MPELLPPAIASDDDYAGRLGDSAFWEPWAPAIPRYDLVALHFGTFHVDKALLGACLDAYGWPARPATWAREMLAFTLLHDFNMFRTGMPLERFTTLDELADAMWNLDAPSMLPL